MRMPILILLFLFRKMLQNRWLYISLLAGMMLCTALTSSLPIYKNAILQRMLIQELDDSYMETARYPGNIRAQVNFGFLGVDSTRLQQVIAELNEYWESNVLGASRVPVLDDIREHIYKGIYVYPEGGDPNIYETKRNVMLAARSGLADHVRLVDGRMPSNEPVDGVIEVLLTDRTLARLGTVIGHEWIADSSDASLAHIRIRPVGVIAEADLYDTYWSHQRLSAYDMVLFMDESAISRIPDILTELPMRSASWYVSFDYRSFTLDAADWFNSIYEELRDYLAADYSSQVVDAPAVKILTYYTDQEKKLGILLWSLNVPLFILVAFYLYMVSGMIADRQKAELAVLWSRGAGRGQIVALYALESSLMALLACAAGPFIGRWLTTVLGSTNSFMSFVQRHSLAAEITLESCLYAAAAAVFAVLLHLLPLVFAMRTSIVEQMRSRSRFEQLAFWHKYGLDVVLTLLGGYGYFHLSRRLDDLRSLGVDSIQLSAEPLLFIIPSVFILGISLIMLRLYPYVLKLIFRIGRTRWPFSWYYAMMLVSRQPARYHMLMIFLILTIGTGIYNASAARTINGNMEEQIWYRNGADIVLQESWPSESVSDDEDDPTGSAPLIRYREPPFDRFENIPGVVQAARVFDNDEVQAFTNRGEGGRVRLLGISTKEFGLTAKFPNGLMPYHLYDYLNLIALDPHAVLVSSSFAEAYDVKPGDRLQISAGSLGTMNVSVYATIDYFPTYNPNPVATENRGQVSITQPHLIVGHLQTMQNELSLVPYDVWLNLESEDSRQALYDWLEENKIRLIRMSDTYEQIIASRNDPFRMAMNGAMSLGFIVSLLITLAGFLLFWMLMLKGRTLEFGIFRASGLSRTSLFRFIAVEQMLTSGTGFLIGFVCGIWAGLVYVPQLEMLFDPARIVPPFAVMFEPGDTVQLIVFVCLMLISALILLSSYIKRLNVHQAVKLGED